MNSLVCLAVLCSVLAVTIQAINQRKIGDLQMTFENGSPKQFCLELDTNKEWALNTTKIQDCFNCKCSSENDGILCIGLGYEDGIAPPEGCVKIHLQDFEMTAGETCCYQFVNDNDRGVTCGEKVCA